MRGRDQIHISYYFAPGLPLTPPLPGMSLRMGFSLLSLGFLIFKMGNNFHLELSVRIEWDDEGERALQSLNKCGFAIMTMTIFSLATAGLELFLTSTAKTLSVFLRLVDQILLLPGVEGPSVAHTLCPWAGRRKSRTLSWFCQLTSMYSFTPPWSNCTSILDKGVVWLVSWKAWEI